jgi:copper transport protein
MKILVENKMETIKKIILSQWWILAVVLILTIPSHALAHAFLYYSAPKAGSTLTNSPAEIKICFTEHLKPHGSTIQVRDAKDKQVDKKDSHCDAKDQSLLFVSLPKLTPGTYKVFWNVISVDKHQTQGHFEFTIK